MNISIVCLGKYNCFWYFDNTHLNERVEPDIGEIKGNENIKMYKNHHLCQKKCELFQLLWHQLIYYNSILTLTIWSQHRPHRVWAKSSPRLTLDASCKSWACLRLPHFWSNGYKFEGSHAQSRQVWFTRMSHNTGKCYNYNCRFITTDTHRVYSGGNTASVPSPHGIRECHSPGISVCSPTKKVH